MTDGTATKRALITGITGQDGSYLAELLLEQGYEVHGLMRRSSTFGTERIDHLYVDAHEPTARLFLHYGDLADGNTLGRLVTDIAPDEVYNLGAQSHVAVSFDNPLYSADVDALGTLRLLEAVRQLRGHVRFYQASSSEMYGKVVETPQSEQTPFHPRSPYGVAKVYSYWQTVNHREAYGMHASNGILFNHESPRRGETFVTRKITRAATRIKLGLQDRLYLGNLDAERDWGFAGDYVEAMWLMLQQDEPGDYVVATNDRRSVRQFCDAAFGLLDLDWEHYVGFDERYLRPAEVDILQGDATKAATQLGCVAGQPGGLMSGRAGSGRATAHHRQRRAAHLGLRRHERGNARSNPNLAAHHNGAVHPDRAATTEAGCWARCRAAGSERAQARKPAGWSQSPRGGHTPLPSRSVWRIG